jgi:hypothetical protein
MRRTLAICALLALGAIGTAGAAEAPVRIAATLNAVQVKPIKPRGDVSRARGSLSMSVNVAALSLSWRLTYSGTTGPVLTATVQYLTPGLLNNLELCHPCKVVSTGGRPDGPPGWTKALVASVKRGQAKVVLDTAKNPRYGEIAGTLKLVK